MLSFLIAPSPISVENGLMPSLLRSLEKEWVFIISTQKSWPSKSLREGLNILILAGGFFLIRLSDAANYDNVLKGGPWFIGDQFLSIQPWEPDFNPATTNCSYIIIWARLLDLPIEYYDPLALTKISRAIGLVLRVDTYTTSKS